MQNNYSNMLKQIQNMDIEINPIYMFFVLFCFTFTKYHLI